MEVKYYSQEKLLIFKITEEIDECKVKNIRRRADYEKNYRDGSHAACGRGMRCNGRNHCGQFFS